MSLFISLFFLLTPFFVLSTFLALTQEYEPRQRHKLAVEVAIGTMVVGAVIYLLGNHIFALFGINLHSFRMGTGILLMLSAINLVQGGDSGKLKGLDKGSISVVPLSIPITVGPATIGYLLVLSSEAVDTGEMVLTLTAFALAALCVGVMLYAASWIERVLGRSGLTILSKITGLILSALAAQMFMLGFTHFV
ncbi:MarC family protein [Spirochaeta africana]|nr:MarC family protein [Spirochaeta africana]